MKHLNLISYFGGKYPHLTWLLDKFPAGKYHFVDAMCGSANVALNVNYPLITINDLNDNVINLFKVLRETPDEFTRAVYYTPFSRAELYKIFETETPAYPVERARHYFTKCQLGYAANGSQNNHKGLGFEYKLQPSEYYKVENWNKKLGKFPQIIEKLRGMQIENSNVLDLIDKVDHPNTLIYIDPPYLMDTRTSGKKYIHDVDKEFHQDLIDKIKKLKNAIVAISGYDHELYDSELKDWQKHTGPSSRATVARRDINECLWTNYDAEAHKGQLSIFQKSAI